MERQTFYTFKALIHVRSRASQKKERRGNQRELPNSAKPESFLNSIGCSLSLDCESLRLMRHFSVLFIFLINYLINYTLQQCIGFAIHWFESAMGAHMFPILNPPSHPFGSSQFTSPEHPVSCIEPGPAVHFTYDNFHVSIPFSHIILPSPSPTESKRLFNISVSLLLSCIKGYHYHLSKLHIYALVYCIGVFLSDLLHSV